MKRVRGEVKSVSSLKRVTILAAAFTFLLSALIWSLPGERFLTHRVTSQTDNDDVKARIKKSLKDKDRCIVQTPSPEDMARLRLDNRENVTSNQHMYDEIREQQNVLCTVETDCPGLNVLSVKCRTNGCSHFVVKRDHSDLPLYDVSPKSLEAIVGLQGSYKTRIKLLCYKGKPHNVSDDNWQNLDVHHRRKAWCKGGGNGPSTPRRIHVISVRFLSRWEVFSRMRRLTELVTSQSTPGIKVVDFSKYQSLVWRGIDNLALLLQGHVFHNESNYTLLDAAKRNGFNVRLFDLSEEDYRRSLSLKSIIKDDKSDCLNAKDGQGNIFDQIPSCNCSIYMGAKMNPEQKLAHLTNCLSRVNAMDGYKGLFTMTFLENTNWDVSLEQTIDVAITNIVKNIISSDSETVILLLSDVGNPSFSNLYNSLFLQTQPSNPFLFIFHSTASEGEDKHSMLAENRDKLISLRDIHVTISDFVSSDVDIDSASKYEDALNQYEGLSLLRSIIPSRTPAILGVQSPNQGICETEISALHNDTMQVAYAETAIGLINNYIQKKTKINGGKMNSGTQCRAVVGKRFLNLRKSHQQSTSITTMDLEIRLVSTNVVKMLKGISVKLHLAPNASHTVSLDAGYGNFETIMNRLILPLVCRERVNVNVSRLQPGQAPLLLGRSRSFGIRPKIMALHAKCLLLMIRGYKYSASYYAMNVCDDREYDFTFTGQLLNVFSVVPLPVKVFLHPGQAHYITSFVKTSYFVKKYAFHYETYYEMNVI